MVLSLLFSFDLSASFASCRHDDFSSVATQRYITKQQIQDELDARVAEMEKMQASLVTMQADVVKAKAQAAA
jgi:hypothetical protein